MFNAGSGDEICMSDPSYAENRIACPQISAKLTSEGKNVERALAILICLLSSVLFPFLLVTERNGPCSKLHLQTGTN